MSFEPQGGVIFKIFVLFIELIKLFYPRLNITKAKFINYYCLEFWYAKMKISWVFCRKVVWYLKYLFCFGTFIELIKFFYPILNITKAKFINHYWMEFWYAKMKISLVLSRKVVWYLKYLFCFGTFIELIKFFYPRLNINKAKFINHYCLEFWYAKMKISWVLSRKVVWYLNVCLI